MDERTAARPVDTPMSAEASFGSPAGVMLRYPTTAFLRRAARKRLPHFAFEYGDGGAGDDKGMLRNWAALDAVEIVPRYAVTTRPPAIDVELFGRRYAAPIGVAPMGSPAVVWPGADELLAKAAQAARIPYVLGSPGGMTIERAGEIAPDVFWFQLYRFAGNDHAIGFDLMRRAEAAGANALVVTIDVPVRTTRPREAAAGLTAPFRMNWRILASLMASPRWLMAITRHGAPTFAVVRGYAGANADLNTVLSFIGREMGGCFTWDDIGRYRDRWKRPLVIKGILHPDDAERAVALGADAVVVSNHGGRQIEALPAPIDVLPAVVASVGHRVPVLMDSGVRSGVDVVRALALGAGAVLVGKAFLWGLGALGDRGPAHVAHVLAQETRAALGQIGVPSATAARDAIVRHPGALRF